MKMIHASRNLLLAAIMAMAVTQISRAQIGSGWIPLPIDKAINSDGGTYNNSNGIETFTLSGTGGNRYEFRFKPDAWASERQLEGYVNVTGDIRDAGVAVNQVYQHGIGDEHQIRVNPAGDMYTMPDHDLLASNVKGTWVKINVIHSIPAETVWVYANGVLKSVRPYTNFNSSYMLKYGAYLGPGDGKTTVVQWKSIKVWQKSFTAGTQPVINLNSRLAMDDPGASTQSGTKIIQYTPNGGNNQNWTFTQNSDSSWTIKNASSGKVLDVSSGSTANGSQIVQNSASGAASQKWFVDPWNDGTWRVKNENSGKLLDVPGASTTTSTILDQWDSTGGNNQRWIIDPDASTGVTFYSSINYGGTPGQVLAKGSYTMSQLAAKGIANDSASSVKIPSGWTVTIYQSDNFGGSSWTRTSDTADFTTISGLNDTMSSCVIQ